MNNLIEEYTSDEELKNTIYEFIKMRKKIKKPMTDYAVKLLLKKLNKFDDKIDVLNQSILNCWQDIYEVKKDLPQWFDKEIKQDESKTKEMEEILKEFV